MLLGSHLPSPKPHGMTHLKRELGLRDLTLFAIACIVGPRWIAVAATAGPGSGTTNSSRSNPGSTDASDAENPGNTAR